MSSWKEWQVYEKKYKEALKAGNEKEAKKYKAWAEEAKISFEAECRRDY